MTGIDYDALRGQSGGEPPDGLHTAYLMRAELVETSRGDRMVTEWQTMSEPRYYWTTWFGFDGQRLSFTQEFLDALGVDRNRITDDALLEQALSNCVGLEYEVRTDAGASWVNTYVEGAVSPDVPIDTTGLGQATPAPQEPVTVPAGAVSDEDIPF
jgi:hypothetical protein